jgi:hypothetical protein
MAIHVIEGKPYKRHILRSTVCMKCGGTIRKNTSAYAVRRGLSFFYYHVKCKPRG